MTPSNSIVASMKRLRDRAVPALLVLVAVASTGCGGVSGSRSVSPSSFFVPGLMRNDTPAPTAPGQATPTHSKPAESTLPS